MIRFAEVLSSRPIGDAIERELRAAYELNISIFGGKPPRFRIVVCHDEEEWRRACAYYYFPLARGVVLRDASVVIKSPKMIGVGTRELGDLLRHELNHVFWLTFCRTGRSLWSPFWVCEGLACIAGGSPFLVSEKETLALLSRRELGCEILHYSYRSKHLSSPESIQILYSAWFHFLRFLFGHETRPIIRLLRRHKKAPGPESFDRLLRAELGRDKRQAFSEFRARAELTG